MEPITMLNLLIQVTQRHRRRRRRRRKYIVERLGTVYQSPLMVVVLLLSCFIYTTDACWRRQDPPAPPSQAHRQSSTYPTPLPTLYRSTVSRNTTATEEPAFHHTACTPAEQTSTACLHDGVCMVLVGHDGLRSKPECRCTSDWSGIRCENRYLDANDYSDSVMEMTTRIGLGVAAALFILILVIVVILIAVTIKHRKKKKNQRRVAESLQDADDGVREINGNGITQIEQNASNIDNSHPHTIRYLPHKAELIRLNTESL